MPEEPLDEAGREILAAVPELGERKTAEAAVDRLIAMRDARVKRLFERLVASKVYEKETADGEAEPVWAPVLAETDEGMRASLYPLLAKAVPGEGEQALPAGPPSEVVDFGELKRFRVFRPALNRIRDSLALIGLELDDPEERRQSAIDTGNKRQAEAVPLLSKLAEEDPDRGVRRAAAESLALIRASGSDPATPPEAVVEAVEELGRLKSIRALGLLEQLAADEGCTPREVAAAASRVGRAACSGTFPSPTGSRMSSSGFRWARSSS